MKECLYYKQLKNNIVHCQLCPRFCTIKENSRGNCGVRKNEKGKLYSLVYGKPVSARADPIEKKPLYHFLPGTNSFSIGTAGCNLHCLYCQNWEISQCKPEEVPSFDLSPEDAVKAAVKEKCKSIAYTYTEPTIFIEYCMDIVKLAGEKNIRSVIVSNGFINKEPLEDFCKYISAANIDFKSFNDEFYKKLSGGSLKPVLEALKILKKKNIWLELTYLIIPGENDDMKEIENMCGWIKKELGNVPLHLSRFFPMYKMKDKKPTSEKTLFKAQEIANKYLDYVYVGNIKTQRGENTYCPKCKGLLIERRGFRILQNNIKSGKCKCGEKIPGIWE